MFKFIRRVLVLVLILFTGYKLFHMYRDVKQVMTYQSLVREVLSEQDTPANEELVLAMIYTETKGKESDVMQSSESASGTTNTISDNRSSIRQGIQTLTENLYLAQEKGVDVWTAVQAYNFGPAYIDFIAQNGKENTLALAKKYSRDTVAPTLGNTTGKTYRYVNPISIFQGGELYLNQKHRGYTKQIMFKFIRRVLVLVLILFTGYKLFHMYRDVKQVMTYQSLVREVLSEQDTPANEELVLAMIYTETKGKESDVMQSSESASGTTNTISDNRSSIRQGIQTLTENLYLAQEKGVDVWTAVQAYNFGPAYIDFIAQNGKENTLALAKKYSRDTVAPTLGNTTGKTYRYVNPISIFQGGELYVDGGNYYYSRQVQLNLYIIKFFNLF